MKITNAINILLAACILLAGCVSQVEQPEETKKPITQRMDDIEEKAEQKAKTTKEIKDGILYDIAHNQNENIRLFDSGTDMFIWIYVDNETALKNSKAFSENLISLLSNKDFLLGTEKYNNISVNMFANGKNTATLIVKLNGGSYKLQDMYVISDEYEELLEDVLSQLRK